MEESSLDGEEDHLYFNSYNPHCTETILLIHGACGSNKEWDDVYPFLTVKGFHILAPDLPAHGKSVKAKPFTVESAAEMLLDLIAKHAHGGYAHVVGLSIGAHIAASMGEKAVDGQILSIVACGYNKHPFRLPTRLLTLPIYLMYHGTLLARQFSEQVALLKNGEGSYKLMAEVIRAILKPRLLGKIHSPTLVVAASCDSWIYGDKIESSKDLLRAVIDSKQNDSRLVVRHDTIHSWHVVEPEEFAKMVYSWIRGEGLQAEFEVVL